MSRVSAMTAAERVLWRQLCQAAHEAAREPGDERKARALKKALVGTADWHLPDLRPLPMACFRAFLTMARGWAPEENAALREALGPRLAGLADAAGDILDGLDRREPDLSWRDRADLK